MNIRKKKLLGAVDCVVVVFLFARIYKSSEKNVARDVVGFFECAMPACLFLFLSLFLSFFD